MADIYSKDGEFDFQKDIYTLNNEKVASEREITLRNKVKVIAGTAITVTTKPKVIALDTYSNNLPKIKLFSELLIDSIIGIAEASISLNAEAFLINRGIVNDVTLVGNANDPVYANEDGEMTLNYTNCKIGILVASGVVLINIGVESSNNDLSLKYDFLDSRDLPTALRRLTYSQSFFEVPIPAGEEGLAYVSIAYSQKDNITIAVSSEGTKRIIRSNNCGVAWTSIIAPAMNAWSTVAYGNGKFVALAGNGTQRCMTSIDGIAWTLHTVGLCAWKKVIFANGIFVAVASSGVKRLMTSTDGITWTEFTIPLHSWRDVAYNPVSNVWIASAYNGLYFLRSLDNGGSWAMVTPTLSGALSPGPLFPLTLTAVSNGFLITSPTVYGIGNLNMTALDVNGTITDGSIFAEYNFETNAIIRGNAANLLIFGQYPSELPNYGIADTINPISALGTTDDGAFIVLTSGVGNKFYRTYIL